MLEVDGVTKTFGGLVAVDDVDFEIGEEEIVGLIGPNGAGKTTLFNLISGFLQPDSGTVHYLGTDTQELMEPSRTEHALVGLGTAVAGAAAVALFTTYTATGSAFARVVGLHPTAVGAVLGFVLGAVAYNLQQSRRRRRGVKHTNPFRLSRAGLVRTFQIVRVFDEQTVLENVVAGATFGDEEPPSAEEAERRAMDALEFVGLAEQRDVRAGSLPIARQKQLELARALATDPDLLLLDEIASGLTPVEIDALTDTIRRIRDERGVSVFWIEHIMEAIMGVADRVIVLNNGQKIAEGTPAEVRGDELVVEAYLGEEA